jgi:hypothetical protein
MTPPFGNLMFGVRAASGMKWPMEPGDAGGGFTQDFRTV